MFNLFQKKDIELTPGTLWHMENHHNEYIIFPIYNLQSENLFDNKIVKCYPYVTIVMYLKIDFGEARWVVPGNIKYAICLIDTTLVAINYDWFTTNMIPIKDYPIHKTV